MSLATRCTACGTIFRVVPDQLRVSEGWVRCGRCAEVFNAQEQVFDIDAEAPPPWPPEEAFVASRAQPEDVVAAEQDVGPAAAVPAHDEGLPEDVADDAGFAAEPPPYMPPASATATSTRAAADERREPEWGEPSVLGAAAHEPALETASAAAVAAPEPMAAAAAPPAAAPEPAPPPAADKLPTFLRPARARTQWEHPLVRLGLSAVALFLSAGLLVQAAWHFRDALAALEPRLRPALLSMCGLLECELQPWRRIDVVSVENSALTQAGSGNNYKLAVTLRNKSGVDVATPWVDLSLTDTNGALVARRMLAPAQFTPPQAVLGAGADQALQLLISTGDRRVTGYSVEIFHP